MAAESSNPLPWTEAYDENGVDLSLVRHSLRQSPTERLRAWQSFVDTVRLARVVEKARASNAGSGDDGNAGIR